MDNSREQEQFAKWQKIKSHLNKHFHEPDFISLRVALAQYAVHFYLNEKPVWCFILGNSGCGKSEIINNGINGLPFVVPVSILNENSFLSGFGEKMGLLMNLEEIEKIKNGILMFNDFSTFLGLREETRKILQSQLRDMFDGSLQKSVGSKNKQLSWKGKITIIANCTPSLERHWTVGNDLGERFLFCRYKPPTVDRTLEHKTIQHVNNNANGVTSEYVRLLRDYANYQEFHEISLSEDYQLDTGLFHLAQLVEWCRTTVVRDNYSSTKSITDVETTSSPQRLFKSALQIAKGAATINARVIPNNNDLSLARKAMLDTMPLKRFKIIKYLLTKFNQQVSTFDKGTLTSGIDMVPITLWREIENLSVIKVLTISKDKFTKQIKAVSLTSDFKEMITNSKILKKH